MKIWNIITKVLTIIVCFCICCKANAQLQPSFENYQLKDGLQSNTIYNIRFAKNNLLYIAHSKGLSSYDGGYFHYYYNSYQPNTELSNILELPNGNIYVKAFNNVVYQLKNDTLQFAFWANNKGGFSNSVAIGNDIIAIATDSIIVFNDSIKKRTAYPYSKPISIWPTANIVIGTWHFSLTNELILILVDDKRNFYTYKPLKKDALPHMHFANGHVFGTKTKELNELVWINKNKKITLQNNINAKVNFVNIIDNEIFISTTKGLFVANQNFVVTKYYGFEQANISAIVASKDNNYFIATLENGLIKVPSFANQQLLKLKHTCNQFAVASNGAIIIDKKFRANKAIDFQNTPLQFVNNDNYIWLQRAVQQAKDEGYVFKKMPLSFANKIPLIKDFTILPNAILFGTQSGLYIYTEKQNYHWLQELELQPDKKIVPFVKLNIFEEYIPTVKYDNVNDKLIVNTYAGIFELCKQNKIAKQLPDPKNTAVKDIEYWQGNLLLATTMHGIVIWNGKEYIYNSGKYPTKGYLKHFYKSRNELWVHGEEGIFLFSKNGNKEYNSNNRIPVENVKNISINDSILYLNNGYNIVAVPKYFTEQFKSTPEIIVHSVKQNNQIVIPNMQLSHIQNDITISFSYINYSGINHHVAYSVNGQLPIHLPITGRAINIPNLTPDDYTIELFSAVNDVISDKPLQTISFVIKPPFYKTLLFSLLLVALSLVFAFLIARYILNNYKRNALHKEAKLMMEKELDKSMLTSIKAQMNPHFLFNALNTIQSYIYSSDRQNASIYISKFSDLTRSILDMSNKETVLLKEEINSLKLYLELEQMRFDDTFTYEIKVQNNINTDVIKIPSMLVQPYVENAIKHGLLHKKTNRKLVLEYLLTENVLTIVIDDNGIGRKRSNELNTIKNRNHTSFAMDANKKRLEILKNNDGSIDFEITDKVSDMGEAIGTKVMIKLKV